MGSIAVRDLLDISFAPNLDSLQDRLVTFANRLDFGLVSAVLLEGDIRSPNVRGRSISNTPAAFIEISRSLDAARRDPVMASLMRFEAPFIYDQRTYVDAGAEDLWESQAPYGYSTGIAVSLHLPQERRFLLGIDRPSRLPRNESKLTFLLDSVQTLAVHAQAAATRLVGEDLGPPREFPRITPQELECLRWSMDGRSATDVGALMNITPRTVNFHLQNVMRKLNVTSKLQAVLKCVDAGLI